MMLYLAGHMRPDIAYAVNCCAWYMFALKLVHEVALDSVSGTNELNVSAYPAGVYLVLVKQGAAVVFSSKLVVE